MSKRFASLAGAGSVALMIGWAAPAMAQTSPDAQAAQHEEADSSLQLEEIVVTARKREERLQDVPISANIQTGAALERGGIANLERMTNYVPNLTIQPSPGVPSLYIRGIGSGPNNPAFEPSVGLFIDGLYMGRGRQTSGDFLDVERIEVLRGPQGALFGKNTSSGAINITTGVPTDERELSASMTGYVAGDKGIEATAVASGPLTDKLKARLALRYDNREGWLYNTAKDHHDPKRENIQGRLTLAYDPSDTVSFVLRTHLFDYDIQGDFFSTAPFGAKKTFTRATTPGVDEFDRGHGANIGLTTDIQLGGGYSLTSITGYSKFTYLRAVDSDFAVDPFFTTQFGESFWQLSQELRISSPSDGIFNWVAGVYAHRAESDNILAFSSISLGALDGTSRRSMDQKTDSLSGYVQGTFRLTEQWRVTAGLRGTVEKKDAIFIRDVTGSPPASWLATDLTGKIDETAFDPSVQIQYLTGPSMFYVSYAKGSKAGGFVAASTAVQQSGFAYDGETSQSFEVGAKLELFDRRAQLNIALFRTKYTDLQVSAWDPIANATLTRNAADATSKGIEAELTARLSSPLTFRGAIGYLDAKYDDFPGALCLYRQTAPAANCLENIGGTRIPRAPKWSASGGLDLDQPVGGNLHVTGNFTVSYRSGIFLDDNLNPASYQSGFAKIDARLGIGTLNGGWDVALVGQNLTNKLTSSYALGTPFAVNTESFSIDPPRVIGLQLRLKY
ncbi:iron complex outermembrane receptor protein [Hephaestia caeni]|uniref:Iron complex outermembrane receptor protein n=1 Tax=Hephaestia caeni TaxID=645617 RepID=A0A397NX27_9SPHN|nr:TonB-dependent receptor [Hephaestia caeni]RIA37951.1 iron complex outermembrane receptor protein [Hephaestia caeni]